MKDKEQRYKRSKIDPSLDLYFQDLTMTTSIRDGRRRRRRTSVTILGVTASLYYLQPLVDGFLISPPRKKLSSSIQNKLPSIQMTPSNQDEDEDDDDDDDVQSVDVSQFAPPKSTISFGLNRGRSAPSQRKAMGTSADASTSVHVCTNCGSEFVKWMGRCPTCREWNTLQEYKVHRGEEAKSKSRPTFGSFQRPSSWLDGTGTSSNGEAFENTPVRVTDVYKEILPKEGGSADKVFQREKRIRVPGDNELNNVLGGGVMAGSITLLGGDPGVGKSTLLLQVAGSVASLSTPTRGIGMGLAETDDITRTLGPVWYVSGEENADQIGARSARLGISEGELWLLSETHVDTLAEQVVRSYQQPTISSSLEDEEVIPGQAPKPPALLVIDSIQTMVCEAGGSSAAGGVTQVRECVALLLRLAKSTGIPIFLVGHVTKSGDVAGPRTVEHMVDCVLYLEGGDMSTIGGVNLRMLRAAKNRFGSADEVGVYDMTSGRLTPVSDPSSLFLSNRIDHEDSEGCSIAIMVEGIRPLTVEVQALVASVSSSGGGYGRRIANGIAYSRLLLLLGVLQKRCGMSFSKQDVYVNVVGRIQLDRGAQEGSASDLAVAVSLVSSFISIPVRSDTAFVAEVGLLGELRPVIAIEKRIQEARRMGFSRVITPRPKGKRRGAQQGPGIKRVGGVECIECDTLLDAINEGLVAKLPKRRKRKRPTDIADGENGNYSPKSAPGRVEDLELDQIIVDEDEYFE